MAEAPIHERAFLNAEDSGEHNGSDSEQGELIAELAWVFSPGERNGFRERDFL